MRIVSQYHVTDGLWGISLLTIFASREFWGFVLLGILFEFERNTEQRVRR